MSTIIGTNAFITDHEDSTLNGLEVKIISVAPDPRGNFLYIVKALDSRKLDSRSSPLIVQFFNLNAPSTQRENILANDQGKMLIELLSLSNDDIRFRVDDIYFPRFVYNYIKMDEFWIPKPDRDGRFRQWGLNPSTVRFSPEYIKKINMRFNSYIQYGETKTPEEQIVDVLIKKRQKAILENRKSRKDTLRKTFILKVQLNRVDPPVIRFLKVSGYTALSTFQGKILNPSMGWSTCYHAYYFTDIKDGCEYGDIFTEKTTVDFSLMKPFHGYNFIDDREVRLGDLLGDIGDVLEYVYDLGVRWEHTITLVDFSNTPCEVLFNQTQSLKFASALNGTPIGDIIKSNVLRNVRKLCIDGGEGACPPEDGNGVDGESTSSMTMSFCEYKTGNVYIDHLYLNQSGNDAYNKGINGGALTNKKDSQYRQKNKDAIASTNYEYDKIGHLTFNYREFDIKKMNCRINDALRFGCMCAKCIHDKNKPIKERRQTSVCEYCFSSKSKLCHCSRCKNVFYCDAECQKNHWKIHKETCIQSKI